MASLLACGTGGKTPSGPDSEQPGNGQSTTTAFADTSLEQAIRQALAQPTGDLSPARLCSLTTLSAPHRGIVDLHGIEQLDSLTALDLSNNRIVDLVPLDSLAHLQMLDLSWNQVVDLSPLAGLSALQSLVLSGNAVRDLTPLLRLGALGYLEVVGNPLDEVSLGSSVPSLQARGVVVWLVDPVAEVIEDPNPVPVLPGRIVFSAKPEDEYPGWSFDIYVCDLERFQVMQVTDDPADERQPVWSPDGRRIAFVRRPSRNGGRVEGDLCVAEVDQSGSHHVTNLSNGRWVASSPTWSPDGRRLACTRWTSTSLYQQVYVMDADGGNAVQLTGPDGYSRDPSWSPDGTRIAFIAKPARLAHAELFAMDPNGGNVTQLSADGLAAKFHAKWSPDGTRIAFDIWNWVYSIAAVGTSQTAHLDHGMGTTPAWLMGARRLLYCVSVSPPSGPARINYDIWLLDLATRERLNLTDLLRRYGGLNTLVNVDPDWSPTSW
jgi:hypothetical protein